MQLQRPSNIVFDLWMAVKMNFVFHREITLAELSEFREGIEGNVAGISAKRVTPADSRRLKGLPARAKKHATAGVGA